MSRPSPSLDQVEQSIDMREYNNGQPLDQGHQTRLDNEIAYRDALQERLGR
jgi:hypothetical protein